MFLWLFIMGMLLMFCLLWNDFMKILILLEIISLSVIMVVLWSLKYDLFSLNFFFSILIFLVCESSLGFILFIFYISMESEVVKKMNLTQF